MLITFKSKAAADVLMYEKHAQPILELFGKDVKRGIITAEETGPAIARLEAEIEERQRRAAEEEAAREADDEQDQREARPAQTVTFSARAYPVLEMLRAAHNSGNDVMWGV